MHYGAAWAQVSAGPFRMFKGFLSEGGIRNPLIISGHGVKGSGRISSAVTHIMDIAATILKAANVSYPTTYDGKELAAMQGKYLQPILDNSRETVRRPSDWVGWELFGNRAIREGNWKLLWLCKPYGPGKWQLYNLRSDPGEMNDVADEYPKVRRRFVSHWRSYVPAARPGSLRS